MNDGGYHPIHRLEIVMKDALIRHTRWMLFWATVTMSLLIAATIVSSIYEGRLRPISGTLTGIAIVTCWLWGSQRGWRRALKQLTKELHEEGLDDGNGNEHPLHQHVQARQDNESVPVLQQEQDDPSSPV